MMDGHELAEVVGAVGMFTLATVLLVAVVTRIAPRWRTRVGTARDAEYRALAESSVRAQEELARQLTAIGARLTDVEGRMSSVERVLRDVE
ncbi:hypothetical protein [Micromonospora siamensis]|uniref:Uncharacterized protein n=1 Tax=Micromonospora siamensis TaxID=299152 RepID=A0A1C5I4S2_9ACTN|nr:hypothetical protein [Micromonospora siamensis]SCG53213.1 hypothetical protein GA0074704_2900 [Micromonospora siamensis]